MNEAIAYTFFEKKNLKMNTRPIEAWGATRIAALASAGFRQTAVGAICDTVRHTDPAHNSIRRLGTPPSDGQHQVCSYC